MKQALTAIVLLLFVTACGQQPAALEQRQEAPPAEPAAVLAPEPAVIVEPPSEPADQVPALDDGTAARLAQEQAEKAAAAMETPPKATPGDKTTIAEQMNEIYQALDSYQFRTFEGTFFVRGEKVKFLPRNAIRLIKVTYNDKQYVDVYIDEIIFDREEKTATGYCFGFDESVNRQCANFELYDIPFPLTYAEYWSKLPDEWLKEYLNKLPSNEEYEKYYVDDVETIRALYADGIQLYFSPRAGLPVMAQITPLQKTKYEDLVINRVRPEDVIHRSKKDIPPEEQFYKPLY